MGVDLGTVSRFKTTVVAVITGCSLACRGGGWVRGWVLGTRVGKSLLWFLVDIHLSWLCQPPTFSILEQWQRKHCDLCLSGMWYWIEPEKTFHVLMAFEYTLPYWKSQLPQFMFISQWNIRSAFRANIYNMSIKLFCLSFHSLFFDN